MSNLKPDQLVELGELLIHGARSELQSFDGKFFRDVMPHFCKWFDEIKALNEGSPEGTARILEHVGYSLGNMAKMTAMAINQKREIDIVFISLMILHCIDKSCAIEEPDLKSSVKKVIDILMAFYNKPDSKG